MELLKNTQQFPVLSSNELKRLMPYSRRDHSNSGIYKIEDGKDSTVCLWVSNNGQQQVLKYYKDAYFDRRVSLDQLKKYQRLVNKASKTISIPSLVTDFGEISFSILPIDTVSEVVPHRLEKYAVSKSAYVRGVELEKIFSSYDFLLDLLNDSDLNYDETKALITFATVWKDNKTNFRQDVMNSISNLNLRLKKMFLSKHVGCDNINLKVSPNQFGFTIVATDIASSVYDFVN
jgi:hypothetical protein